VKITNVVAIRETAVPSSLAVDMGEEAGLTLGRLLGGLSMNVCTGVLRLPVT
jgi:hypothetical protein